MSARIMNCSRHVPLLLGFFLTPSALAQTGNSGGQQQTGVVSPEAGAPFPWEAGIQVSTYSSVNLFNGNVVTRIPFASWRSDGPDMEFAFYHNSGAVIGEIEAAPGTGFDYGPGWSASYTGQIVYVPEDDLAHAVEDDGLVKTFSWNGAAWIAPSGVHDKLEQVGSTWVLTRKNQWRRIFDSDGRMVGHYDANTRGDAIRTYVERWGSPWDGWLQHVNAGSGGTIRFKYGDPDYVWVFSAGTTEREWKLWHYGTNRLQRIEFVHEGGVDIQFTYDTAGRILTITDKEGRVYTYDYDQYGRLESVTDPEPYDDQSQAFDYAWLPTNNRFRTTYSDRMGEEWQFLFNDWGGLIRVTNPLDEKRHFDYDSDRNRNFFKNELNQIWDSEYDSAGNLTAMANPLGQRWEFTYDSLNNLTFLTPPLNDEGDLDTSKTVAIEYEDYYDVPNQLFNDPTHATAIIEPADGQGNSAATTTLEYFQTEYEPGFGELRRVVDAGGAQTVFKYIASETGFATLTRFEGPTPPGPNDPDYRVTEWFSFDMQGRLNANGGYNSGATFDYASCQSSGGSGSGPTDMQCGPFEGGIATGTPPADPPNGHLPDTDCCDYIAMPHCQVDDPDFSCGDACLDRMNRLLQLVWPTKSVWQPHADPVSDDYEKAVRNVDVLYDEPIAGLPRTVVTTESSVPILDTGNPGMGPSFQRSFTFTPDANRKIDYFEDADGVDTDYIYDATGRLKQIKVDGTPIITYTLYATGRPQSADYASGIRTEWIYDAAQRLDKIRHTDGATLLLELDYGYSPDGLVTSIAQSDALDSETIEYEYDKRGRLIHESGSLLIGGGTGILPVAIDLVYTYDQVGNRLTKTDASVSPSKVTTYYYDVHDSNWETVYGTFNNRLMKYETAQGEALLEQTWYAYNPGGQVKRIVRRWPTSPPAGRSSTTYYITCMQYNIDQQLWLLKEMECPVGGLCTPDTATTTRIREFRYDGDSRQRYLVRERDPQTFIPISNTWREYQGSNIYAELEVNETTGASEATRRYLHGYGLVGWQDTSSGEWQFVLPDMLGSTRLVTDGAGNVGRGLAYTAFGEIAGQTNPSGAAARSRYGYCGAWGYENDGLTDPADEFGLLHVGARYYSAGSGRFVQRDPIGVAGGPNVYEYCYGAPLQRVDPRGLDPGFTLAGQAAISGVRAAITAAAYSTAAVVGVAIAYSTCSGFEGAVTGAAAGSAALGTFILTGDLDYAADQLGLDRKALRRAIEQLKQKLKTRCDVEIDTETGDIYINGEDVGNAYDIVKGLF